MISAQSPPTAQTSPTPVGTPPKQSEIKPGLVIDPGADKYKLVFAPSYDGKLRFTAKEKAAQTETRRSSSNNFIVELNLAGQDGYKMISVLGNDFALVKLDETRHEYDWFETISTVPFAKSGIREKLQELSKTGFRIVVHSMLGGSCLAIDSENQALGENCEYLDSFVVEKESGSRESTEQILINTFPGWGAKPSIELEKQIDASLAAGFYPADVFSAFEILLERAQTKDELPGDKPDVRIVRTSWGKSDVEEKVNELAKQGYRLALTGSGIVVMYRNQETATIPVAYVWLKPDRKNFEKELARLQQQGAAYKTTYPSERGAKNTLIFERKLTGDGRRSEFRILNLEFSFKENKTEKKVYVELTNASKKLLNTMNQLIKEGFEVRDLFDASQVGMILERIKE